MTKAPLRIAPLSHEHVRPVARLHCARLTGLLTELGPAAARAYYAGCVTTPLAIGRVAIEGGVVRGFVLGSTAPGGLKRDVVKRRPVAIAAAIAWGIVRRPPALLWLLRSFRGPDEGAYDATAAELTYLAVAAGQQRGGIGRELVNAFTAAVRDADVGHYELSVDDGNAVAIGFYERLGFVRVGRYREFGQFHLRYRLETRAADAVPPQ